MRSKLLLLTVSLLMIVISGCNNERKDSINKETQGHNNEEKVDLSKYKLPTVDENVILTNLKNCDMTFCYDHFSQAVFRFDIVTYKEITEDNTIIKLDTDIPYKYGISKAESEEIGYENLLAYNNEKYQYGVDCEYSIKEEDYNVINELITPIYNYTVEVVFEPEYTTDGYINTDYDDNIINNMIIEVNGKEYVFDIGEIRFDNTTKTYDIKDDNQALVMETFGTWNTNISYNPGGEFTIFEPDWGYAEEDFCFTHIEDINAGNTYNVSKYEILVERDGITKNYLWKEGEVIRIKKGDRISFKETCNSDVIKSEMAYNINAYILVKYKTDRGENLQRLEMECRMSDFTAYDMWSYYVDDIDVYDFYVQSAYEYMKDANN